MWSNQKSLQVVVPQKLAFKPPYCANEYCPWHDRELAKKEAVFHRHGTRPIARFPYISPRFRCTRCRHAFTASFFSLNYRDRLPDTYEEMAYLRYVNGGTKWEISRFLGFALDTAKRRFEKIERWSLLILADDTERLRISESIAYDGIENFSFSQFDPNNINHAVGRESGYIYDFNFSPLNRKGRISERQKQKARELEKIYGKYPRDAIRRTSERLFRRIIDRADPKPLVLHTDNHFAYREALLEIKTPVSHLVTSAKVARNYRNRLFAINHTDMLTRHHLAAFKRETIAFAKHSIAMQGSFVAFAVFKNYMRPKFLKPHRSDPRAHLESPAMKIGLRKRILSFSELFQTRITKAQVQLNEDWRLFFERIDPYSRRPIRAYEGI